MGTETEPVPRNIVSVDRVALHGYGLSTNCSCECSWYQFCPRSNSDLRCPAWFGVPLVLVSRVPAAEKVNKKSSTYRDTLMHDKSRPVMCGKF